MSETKNMDPINEQLPRFSITGSRGLDLRIEVSTNLIEWLPLTTQPNPEGTFDFIDPDAAGYPFRFYRAIEP